MLDKQFVWPNLEEILLCGVDFITIVVYVKLMIHSWTLNEMKRGATKGE